MGKIRIKHLGIAEFEREEREKRRRQRNQKKIREKEKKVTRVPGLKGGQRIIDMSGEEEIDKLTKISKGAEEIKKKTLKESATTRKRQDRSKRYRRAVMLVDKQKLYSLEEAVKLLRKINLARFNASIEVHINTREKGIRGTVILPHGTGKERRVAIVNEELLKEIEKGKFNFDVLVAHPSVMPKLLKYAKVLGPKGLMPNPKAGTISRDPEKTAGELQKGKVEFKTESKQAVIHQVIGRMDFDGKKIKENFEALINAIGIKNIKSLTLKSSISPGIKVAIQS